MNMPHIVQLNYRQQRALETVDRAAVEFDIAVRTHAPRTEMVRQAQRTFATVVETLKTAIMSDEGRK